MRPRSEVNEFCCALAISILGFARRLEVRLAARLVGLAQRRPPG